MKGKAWPQLMAVPYLIAGDRSGTQERSRGEGIVDINDEGLRPLELD
jgi:hypothetical protein